MVFCPDREIFEEFRASTRTGEWAETFRAFEASRKLLAATWALDSEKVAAFLEEAHDRTANKTYNNETALSYAVQLAYYAAQKYYTTVLEIDTGKGYADIAYLPAPQYPEKPALLIELKYENDVETALSQIRDRNDPQILDHYKGNILLVAINYNKNIPAGKDGYKRHSCVIEQA